MVSLFTPEHHWWTVAVRFSMAHLSVVLLGYLYPVSNGLGLNEIIDQLAIANIVMVMFYEEMKVIS